MRTPIALRQTFALLVFFVGGFSMEPMALAAPDWIRTIDYDQQIDRGQAVAVKDGHVYVTGSSVYDDTRQVVTAKYGLDGTGPLWIRYHPTATPKMFASIDPTDIALLGNDIYVVSRDNGRLILLKYDVDGNFQWVADDFGGVRQWWFHLAARGGRIFVGATTDTNPNHDFTVACYQPDGTRLWKKTHSTAGTCLMSAMAIDADGNVCVTGREHDTVGSNEDILTVKYSSTGSKLWANRYDGPAHRRDVAGGLATDDAGNVYVVGTSVAVAGGGETGPNVASPAPGTNESTTIKYGPAGQLEWIKRLVGGPEGGAAGRRVAVQGSRIYVSGSVKASPDETPRVFACVYDIANNSSGYGKESWVKVWHRYETDVNLVAMAVDSAGVVSLCASVFDRTSLTSGLGTRSFKANGSVWNAPEYYWVTKPVTLMTLDMAVDSQQNMYVVGSRGRMQGYGTLALADIMTLKFGSQIGLTSKSPVDTDIVPQETVTQVQGFVRGDADGDGAVELNDGLAILNHLFQKKRGRGLRCVDAADADDSGAVELNDAIRILNFKFLGGASPVGYFGKSCAPDPGPGLGCGGYDSCPAPRPVDTSLQAAGGDMDPVWEPRTDPVAKPVNEKVNDPVVKLVVPKVKLPTLKPRQPTTKLVGK